jgi:spore coat protein A
LDRYLIGKVIEPAPEEAGWKDIVIAPPELVSRIALRFDLPTPLTTVPGTSAFPATYIQHCHMLEHEDNEMMRPWQVVP